jgi:hypothetical protein
MRNWLKKIIKECLIEMEQEKRYLRANRDPSPYDFHPVGTIWNNFYSKEDFVLKEIKCNWEKMNA